MPYVRGRAPASWEAMTLRARSESREAKSARRNARLRRAMFACGRRLFEIAKLNAPLDPEAEFLRLRNAIIDEVARVASADPDVTLDRAAVIEIIGRILARSRRMAELIPREGSVSV